MVYAVAKRGVVTIIRGEWPHSERLLYLYRIRAGAQLWI